MGDRGFILAFVLIIAVCLSFGFYSKSDKETSIPRAWLTPAQ